MKGVKLFIISGISVLFLFHASTEVNAQFRKIIVNTQHNLNDVKYNNGKLLVVGDVGVIRSILADSMRCEEDIESGTTIDLNGIDLADSSESIPCGNIVGKGGLILKTSNGGTSWNPANSGTTNDLNKIFYSYCPTTKESWAYVVGNNSTVLCTKDSGDTWAAQSTPYQYDHLYTAYFYNNEEGWLAGSTGIIYNTSNGGTAWNYIEGCSSNPNYYAVFFKSLTEGWVGGSEGKILHTTNKGANWTQQNSGTNNSIFDIEFTNSDSGFCVGERGLVLETTNGGNSWTSLDAGTTKDLNAFTYDSEGYMWAVGDSGTVVTNRPLQIVGVEKKKGVPTSTQLMPAYPNPFNPSTNIRYALAEPSKVSLIVFDVMGRKIATLVDNESRLAGTYTSHWNGSNAASGIYFLVLQTSKTIKSQKLVMLK